MVPNKLKPGDEVRVIAPSRSMVIIGEDCKKIATDRLESLGLKVTFGKHVMEADSDYLCASIESRVEDLNEAFRDKNVKAILTVIGGFNSNQILNYIDYEAIKGDYLYISRPFRLKEINIHEIKKIVSEYINNYFNFSDDKQTWFDKMKDLAEEFGYAREVKEFKANPDMYKAHVGDVSTVLRVALTGRTNTPDMYEIMQVLGKDSIIKRFEKARNC